MSKTDMRLCITHTRYPAPFSMLFGNVVVLERNCKEGEIILIDGRKYLLSSTLNPELIFSDNNTTPINNNIRIYKKGDCVQIALLDLIDRMESEIEYDIPGFKKIMDTTRFYSIKDFDKDFEPIIDELNYHDVDRYYYVRS